MIRAIKQHPIAALLFFVYALAWIFLCYITYYFLVEHDADTLTDIVFYWYMVVCVPYLASNIFLSYRAREGYRKFYKDMSWLVFIPMGVVVGIFVVHALIAYANKGI